MSGWNSNLNAFLPSHSYVMGRRQGSSVSRDSCLWCGSDSHSFRVEGKESAPVVLWVESAGHPESFMSSPEGELYQKILEAMKWPQDQIGTWIQDRAEWPSVCQAQKIKKLVDEQIKAVVIFGPAQAQALVGETTDFEATRGKIQTYKGIRILTTESLEDMLRDAGLKKRAWSELKLALSEFNLGEARG